MIDLIAHRGNARDFPENTLPALRSAFSLGVRCIELDVQLAADATPVIIHDHELRRTAGLPGTVFDHPGSYLATVEVNERQRLGARFTGVRIPLLGELVALLEQQPDATAFVEIKRASLRQFGREVTVARVLQTLAPARKQCVVISFDRHAVALARAEGFAIGWVLSEYDGRTRDECAALQPEFLFCDHQKLPKDGSGIWQGPWKWALYEVDTPELAIELHARGADFIETMAVATLAQALATRQM